jgi:hypothetical protein
VLRTRRRLQPSPSLERWRHYFLLADHSSRIAASAGDVSRKAKLGSSIEVEGLFVSLDGIALRFPARQSTFEEFHP